jgi:hypothetical protein
MEILTLLWSALSLALSLIWQLAWFVLRDVVSTLVWLLIIAWLLLSVRYRSFYSGTRALLRYGGYGIRLFWQWLRGAPLASVPAPAKETGPAKVRYRTPIGTMSLSGQLNMLLVGALYLLFLA